MLSEAIAWLWSIDPEFAFLLALPFVVALAAFIGHGLFQRAERNADDE